MDQPTTQGILPLHTNPRSLLPVSETIQKPIGPWQMVVSYG